MRPTTSWFSDLYGFSDETGSFEEHRAHFRMDGEDLVCATSTHPRQHVGPWETPSVAELRERCGGMTEAAGGSGLTFRHLTASSGVEPLISNPDNAGAVFMVASQFNALEMVSPDRTPRRGIAIYARDRTQGPACAMACPAGTVFRNYLCQGGSGQATSQIDLLADVGTVVGNTEDRYWRMQNGWALVGNAWRFQELSRRLRKDAGLHAAAIGALRVGVHAATQARPPLTHRVAQVFCSALPVAYIRGTHKFLTDADWELARVVLCGAYEATLAVGAWRAAEAQGRVAVFLTALGDGSFGNDVSWVREALEAALDKYRDAPLDVALVHYGVDVDECWRQVDLPPADPMARCVRSCLSRMRECYDKCTSTG